MKTLTINRPKELSELSRYHSFMVPVTGKWPERADVRSMSARDLVKMVQYCGRRMGNGKDTSADEAILSLIRWVSDGSRLVVDRDLSRDLEVSSVTGDLSGLAWPSNDLLITFQDEDLPELLLTKSRQAGEPCYQFSVSMRSTSGVMGVKFTAGTWRSYVDGEDAEQTERDDGRDWAEENLATMNKYKGAVRYLICLCAKVLAYASVPRHMPVKLLSKAEKKAAGIHPNQQTNAPTLLYRRLPRIVRDPIEETTSTGDGQSHKFMGRAGHLRLYSHERYKEMKGQWQWIPPIPPPEGIQVIYKVRKVGE